MKSFRFLFITSNNHSKQCAFQTNDYMQTMHQNTTEEYIGLEELGGLKMVLKAWEILYKFHHLIGLLLVAFTAAALYLARDNSWNAISVLVAIKQIQRLAIAPRCDYFSGSWVYDNVSYPLYKESQCSFIENAFACERQGREDFDYQKWRWQPHQCNLPRCLSFCFIC